mgnify:CR=1 FL=1
MQNEPKRFCDLGIKAGGKTFTGEKIKIYMTFNTEIVIHHFEIIPSKWPKKEGDLCLCLQLSVEGIMRVCFTGSKNLMNMISQVPDGSFPFLTKVVNNNKRYEFT